MLDLFTVKHSFQSKNQKKKNRKREILDTAGIAFQVKALQ